MRDGTDSLRAPAPQIETRILRHILLEATDLLDESAGYAEDGARSTHAAMALTRAHWLLMSVYRWITEELEPTTGSVPAPELAESVAGIGIEFDDLSQPLQDFAKRVDRLHARTLQLQALTNSCSEAVVRTDTETPSCVLNIFGDAEYIDRNDNPVIAARRLLNCALSGI